MIEVFVEVRMYSQRPKISNVMLVGPKLGRFSYTLREEVPLSMEEEEPYAVTKEGGLISTGAKTKVKKLKGTVTKEMFKFKVPWNKIISGKRYQLWVDIQSKTAGGTRPQKYKFNLDKLSE